MTNSISNTKSIFRENALNSLNAITDIQYSLKVVDVKSITYLMAAFLIFSGIVIWGIFGSLTVEIPATGILLTSQQIEIAEQRDREAREEKRVSLEEKKSLLLKKQMLYDKHYLTIDEVDKARQEYLDAKSNMNTYSIAYPEQLDRLFDDADFSKLAPMEALVFVSHDQGKKIVKGSQAYLLPSTLSSYEYGYINGSVRSISEFPATKESVYAYLGNASLVDEYFSGGSPFVVKIKLESRPGSASGLRWTTDNGAPFRIDAGSVVSAKIISSHYRPYQLLMKQYLAG